MSIIRVSCLSAGYPNAKPVLDNVNLDIEAGEKVALVGPSGSGKTTLLWVLSGLLSPTAGSVEVIDKNLYSMTNKMRSKFRSQHMGFVLQFGHLVPELTAAENVMLPVLMNGVYRSEARNQAEELLAAVGVSEVSGSLPAQLSGGQMQRVAVARALIHRPSIILADEPTGALDQGNTTTVVELLTRSQIGANTSTVVVTHDTSQLKFYDRVLDLQELNAATSQPNRHDMDYIR